MARCRKLTSVAFLTMLVGVAGACPTSSAETVGLAMARCGSECNHFYDQTGRWKALADPSGSGRVVCSNWRLTVTMNDTAHTLPNLDIASKNRTYQGYYPTCPDNLPQATNAMRTHVLGYLNDEGFFYKYIDTLVVGNEAGRSTAISTASLDQYTPEGYYYFRGAYTWTAWGVTYRYQSPDTPTWFYCRTDQHVCS